MVTELTETLLACIPGIDEDCDLPPDERISDSSRGFDKGDLAVILHGLVAIANVAVPVTMRFMVIEYQLLPSLSQYSSDYFGICGILYWIAWQAFWAVHSTLFGVPAFLWVFTYFGYGPTWLFVSFLNMTYFASFILYPILLGAFAAAASPYVLRTKAERDLASFGEHGEDYSFFVYFGLIFVTMWV